MAKPNKATQAKRGRELAKQSKRQEKEERRVERKGEKMNSPRLRNGEDPDLVGIYPGPQKPLE